MQIDFGDLPGERAFHGAASIAGVLQKQKRYNNTKDETKTACFVSCFVLGYFFVSCFGLVCILLFILLFMV